MATDTWTDGSDNWETKGDWSGGLPGSTSNVVIDEGDPQVTASFGTIASLTDGADLTFIDAGKSTVTGAVTNSGSIILDNGGGDGGSSLTIGGALTSDGYIQIGPDNNSLSAASTVNAASVANFIGTAFGTIDIFGASTVKATLDDAAAAGLGAANTLIGDVSLSGDALLEFASGEITTIDSDSGLSLSGPKAFVADKSSTTSSSALTGLNTIDGNLTLINGATVTTSGALSNSGSIILDNGGGDGASSLTIGGALTSDGYIQIGPDNDSLSSASTVSANSVTNFIGTAFGTIDVFGNDTASLPKPIPAALDISGAAGFGVAGKVEGDVNVEYDGRIVFGSGQITTIAADSELTLVDKDAVVADAGSLTSNSALTGLNTIDGSLTLINGATVTTSGALSNSGSIILDNGGGDGGSSLTIGGALTNDGYIQIGPDNDSLSSATTVSASSITNFIRHGLRHDRRLWQRHREPSQADPGCARRLRGGRFRRRRQARGQRQCRVRRPDRVRQGQITTIAADSELTLVDKDAVVADAGSLTSNSALTGLATIDGGLYLYNGATVTTSGALSNSGTIILDNGGGDGGSSLTVGGALTNDGYIQIGPDNDSLVVGEHRLRRQHHQFRRHGLRHDRRLRQRQRGPSPSRSRPRSISPAAAGFGKASTVEGNVNVDYDGQIVFGKGQITTIAAHSELTLIDKDAVVADSRLADIEQRAHGAQDH